LEFFVTKLPRATPGRGGKRHSDKLGRPKVHPVVDMTGKKKGSWTFLLCLTPGKGMTETRYIMRCDCGHTQEMQIHNILSGESESCHANCGRGKQIREYGWLEPGQTPGSKPHRLERWQQVREAKALADGHQAQLDQSSIRQAPMLKSANSQ